MSSFQMFGLLILVQVTVILATVAILLLLLRRSAASRHSVTSTALWLVLLCPAFVPFLPQRWAVFGSSAPNGKASVTAQVQDERPAFQPHASADLVVEVDTSPPAEHGVDAQNSNNERVNAAPTQSLANAESKIIEGPSIYTKASTAAVQPPENRWARLDGWAMLLMLIWGVGIVIAAIRQWWRGRDIRRIRETLQPIDEAQLPGDLLAHLANKTGINSADLRIMISDALPTPAVLGVLKPVIVVPTDLLQNASQQQLADVLIHECAHVVRRDPWVHVLQKLAGVIYWLHPGVAWLNRQLSRSREEVCDNYVLRQTNPADYAQTLLQLTERCGGNRPALSLLGLFNQRWCLESRVTDLLNPERETMVRSRRLTMLFAVAFMSSCCLLTGGVADEQQADIPKNDEAAATETAVSDLEPAQDSPAVTAEAEPDLSEFRKVGISGFCEENDHDADEVRLVAGARVRVFRYSSVNAQPVQLAEMKTDADGRFAFENVASLVDRTALYGLPDLVVVAEANGYVTAVMPADNTRRLDRFKIRMSNKPATLSGVVRDEQNTPVAGATVYTSTPFLHPIPAVQSDKTDKDGRFTIDNLGEWNPHRLPGYPAHSTRICFRVTHPDFAVTTAKYTATPQVVDVTMHPPGIVEGTIIDLVSGKPISDAKISAQGIARSGWFQTRSDRDGHYRLRVTGDHYNIWAESKDRMPIAVKALEVRRGQKITGADIRMARGGFVYGVVTDAFGKPIKPGKNKRTVAHYGPARPRIGSAVSSTTVNQDGTYRLHVAPGRNYVYLMNGAPPKWVTVGDGQEVEHNIGVEQARKRSRFAEDDADEQLRHRIQEKARIEDAMEQKQREAAVEHVRSIDAKDNIQLNAVSRAIDELMDLNTDRSTYMKEPWAEAMRNVVKLGDEAVPGLIAVLDSADDNRTLRCLGFCLRAIGDKRAVPALIRAIPRTLRKSGSDMGLSLVGNEDLLKFMQKHDLDSQDRDNQYGFGRPVREILGALDVLTEQDFGQAELIYMSPRDSPPQDYAQAKLFYRHALKWKGWWEVNWSNHVKDKKYSTVNLQDLQPSEPPPPIDLSLPLKTSFLRSNIILMSAHNSSKRQSVLLDLDTGRKSALPKKWQNQKLNKKQIEDITKWAAAEGFDVMGDEYVSADNLTTFAIRAIGLKAWELEDQWKTDVNGRTLQALQKEGRATTGEWLLHFDKEKNVLDPAAHTTFLYITADGTPGIMYVGIEVRDNSLQPGGRSKGDNELNPVAFFKGRRFGLRYLK